MKKIIIIAYLFSVLSIFKCFSMEEISGLQNKINNIMQWEEKFGFSGSVLIVKDGEIIFSEGYGYANREAKFENTPSTAFYIASVSKPVTALAIMKLVEEKKIILFDNISKYFTGVPEDKKGITVEMLLTHTSGLKHTYSCDNITDRSEAVKTILIGTDMAAEPGQKYNYSGDNYTLLAALIEITSGYKFETFISEKILKPAGIETPAFAGNLQLLKFDDIAEPSENSIYKSLRDINPSWGNKGRAGMILSIEDLYKLDEALEGNKLLGSATVQDMLSPKIKNASGSNYGYGFTIGKTIRGTKVFGHSGDDDAIGHNIEYLDFPDEKVKIFIASNSNLYSGTSWSSVISSQIQRILFSAGDNYNADKLFYNEFGKNPVDSLERYEGVYESANSSYHVWLNNDRQLILSPVGYESGLFSFPDAYNEKNKITSSIIDETHNLRYDLLEKYSKDKNSFEKIKNLFSGLWQTMEKKNGPLERIEITGTANIWAGNYQSEIATWFRLIFKNKIQSYRLEWDSNNKITGLGGSRIQYPMMFTLNSIAKKEFIGFDAANGRTIAVNFLPEKKGNMNTMELNISNNKPVIIHNTGSTDQLPLRSAAELLYFTIKENGIQSALDEADVIQKNKLSRFDLDEGELNDFGYKLLNEKNINEAITMFEISVKAFPESSNAFDSLGEAYMKAGKKSEAVKNYERSLELDSKNENARKMIEDLSK